MKNPTNDSSSRPQVVAVLGCHDHGPMESGGTCCPHCGAEGRYVFECLMSDGTTKGMMRGCLATFKKDDVALDCENALNKHAHHTASRWDMRIINAITAVRSGTVSMDVLRQVCWEVRREKQTWMRSKGYRR